MKLNISFDTAIILSIIAIFLFANGQAFLGSYFWVYGIDITTLNLSIQDKIYFGYVKGFNYLLYSVLSTAIFVILIYFVRYTNCLKKLDKFISDKLNKNKPLKHSLNIHNSNYYDELDINYKKDSSLTIFILIILLSTIFLLANSEGKAKAAAYKDLKDFDFRQVKLKDKTNTSDVYLIKCGTTLCALIDKNKNVTLEEPKNIIFFVRPEEKKKAP